MIKGKAPIGPDGKRINLHHLIQSEKGSIAEVTASMHTSQSSIIHVNPNIIPSGINRNLFTLWRQNY